MLHDEVIEVATGVNGAFFVEATLVHEVIDFVNQLFAHLEQLGARHLVVSVDDVGGRVRQTRSLE